MPPAEVDERLARAAMFAHLDRLLASSPDGSIRSDAANTFVFGSHPLPLVVQQGIRKPAGFDAALTIRTAYTPPNTLPPYSDAIGDDGLVRYKYRGTDPAHPDNRALRAAMKAALPLAYFIGVAPGVYVVRYPVWLVAEDRQHHEFAVAVDEGQRLVEPGVVDVDRRDYLRRLTNLRLHQPVFRARVLRAYTETCAMCRLRHADLLDAAHILPDTHPQGLPVVQNGLALCKIHHAAYDRNILGVRPDFTVQVQRRVLAEIDGPMLRHGLQEMAGVHLHVPRTKTERPDPDRLAERYEEFQAAS